MADRARAVSGRRVIDPQRSLAASAGAVIRQCCRHAFDVCKRGDDLLDALVRKVLVGTPPTSASNYWEDGPVRQAIAPPAVSFYVARVRLTEMAVEAAIAYTNYPTREAASTGRRRDQGALKRLRQRFTRVRERVAVGEVDAVARPRQRTGGRWTSRTEVLVRRLLNVVGAWLVVGIVVLVIVLAFMLGNTS